MGTRAGFWVANMRCHMDLPVPRRGLDRTHQCPSSLPRFPYSNLLTLERAALVVDPRVVFRSQVNICARDHVVE